MLQRRSPLMLIAFVLMILAALACVGGTETGTTPSGGGVDSGPTEIPSVNSNNGTGATLTVTNNSTEDICNVRISEVTDEFWGDSDLGAFRRIGPGESLNFNVAPGDYDLRAENCSDAVILEEYGFTITTTFTWTVQ
ncbi:MAG: hypothetical protein GYB68_19565 [Chloroflexi bacterium]|nr:hypothetical protein [Chloroflexota bacterium]